MGTSQESIPTGESVMGFARLEYSGFWVRNGLIVSMKSTDWFWEGNVADSLGKYFVNLGWEFVSKADTASRAAGVDLHLRKRLCRASNRGQRISFGALSAWAKSGDAETNEACYPSQ